MNEQNVIIQPVPLSVVGVSRRSMLGMSAKTIAVGAAGVMLGACGSGSADGGGNAAFYTRILAEVTRELAQDETAHVQFLRQTITALGGTPVAKPAINLAALGAVANETQFLNVSRAFEDTGVSAYGGAARFISNKDVLEAAARILATEAYHAGNIRLQVVERDVTTVTLDSKDQPPTHTNYIPTDSNGLAIIRTPAEVVAIVAPFFPSGINGTTNPTNDLQILNFALNLEYLEAEFYLYVATGTGLSAGDTSGSGTLGTTTGAPTLRLSA